jgi:hypothetical protein
MNRIFNRAARGISISAEFLSSKRSGRYGAVMTLDLDNLESGANRGLKL